MSSPVIGSEQLAHVSEYRNKRASLPLRVRGPPGVYALGVAGQVEADGFGERAHLHVFLPFTKREGTPSPIT